MSVVDWWKSRGASVMTGIFASVVPWNILRRRGKAAVTTPRAKTLHTASTKSPNDSHAMFTVF
jgi:hypothetical protein